MSQLLDQAARLDPQRAADLGADDALEQARIAADLEYLNTRSQREQQRAAETAQLEAGYFSRMGWIL